MTGYKIMSWCLGQELVSNAHLASCVEKKYFFSLFFFKMFKKGNDLVGQHYWTKQSRWRQQVSLFKAA